MDNQYMQYYEGQYNGTQQSADSGQLDIGQISVELIRVIDEIQKVIKGKREIICKIFMAICASGNVLLEDNPGSGKTTMAKAFARAIDLQYKRIQFTPDTMPTDITGYTYFTQGDSTVKYAEGAVMCNILLADEINRTSAKTQSALLEAMEEKTVTLEGKTTALPDPFVLIATQNPNTSLGTQPLPDSQCDRFMVKLSMGYPQINEEVDILRNSFAEDKTNYVNTVMSKEMLVYLRKYIDTIYVSDLCLEYICTLCDSTRNHKYVDVGISTRGAIALKRMAAAYAMFSGRNYVIPSDISNVFLDVCGHRLIISPQAELEEITVESILQEILKSVQAPELQQ